MELHLSSSRMKMQTPDWLAAVVAGIVAGAALMVLSLLWAATDPASYPWMTARRIAAIAMGPQVLGEADFSVGVIAVMALTHYGLGVIFGLLLAAIVAAMHIESSPGKVVSVGALFGLLLYVVNFYAMAELYPWFTAMRGGATLIGHLIFGMLAAGLYWKLERHDLAAT